MPHSRQCESSYALAWGAEFDGCRSKTMHSHTEIMPIEAAAVSTTTLKQRLSTICYLTAIAVAMLGWVTALGWTAVAVANWLFA
jgi:hypothetical protein